MSVTLDPSNPAHVLIARRASTYLDPVAFARRYLARHITDDAGRITFAECHRQWADFAAMTLSRPRKFLEPAEERHAFFAPRETGKSTWWLLIIPLWAAAHGHSRFAAIFADTGPQAKMHLETFRKELKTNERLRTDFPDLCAPAMLSRGRSQADRQDMIVTRSGFIMAARGMDSGSLGMKVEDARPDLLLIDDPEPSEDSYSAYQAQQRLTTLLDAVLPLNIRARVVYSGTVTMYGSIAHQLIRHGKGEKDALNEWCETENFQVHHSQPILTDDAGNRRSLWPAKWPLGYLLSIAHTRSYAKNYANDPRGADGGYWSPQDFVIKPGDNTVKAVIQIDPATTEKRTSDFTGIAVLSYDPYAEGAPPPVVDPRTRKIRARGRVTVHHVRQVKVAPGEALVAVLRDVLAEYPFVGGVAVESNQGGDVWYSVLAPLGLPVAAEPVNVAKEVRAADALHHFQTHRVVLAAAQPEYEAQACSFPRAANDDMVDAVNAGVLRWLSPVSRYRAQEKTITPK